MGMEVSDYRAMFGGTGDQQILVNILSAKDGAPLHFTELQTLGATNQMSTGFMGQGVPNSGTAPTLTGTAGVQANPTFGLATLDLQPFTVGLTDPVSPVLIQQFFEEGIDQRLLFLLFFSAIVEGPNTYLNNIKCDKYEQRCYDHFFNYLSKVDRIGKRKVVARIYQELTPTGFAPASSATGVKDLTGIDTTKYRIEPDRNDPTKIIVYQIGEPRLALCWVFGTEPATRLVPVLPDQRQGICENRRAYVYARARNAPKSLITRSTYEIIEYLGQVLTYQELKAYENRCIQLGAAFGHRGCDEGDVLFQVNPARGAPLVTAGYRGYPYTIGVGPCDENYCDHSAEVLKIVNLLINYNKAAANFLVPTVRTVQ